jgi:DNA processing protein
MDAAEFDAWFRLLDTPGVGRGTARRLVAACGTPEAVLATPRDTLRQLAGEAVAQALRNPADAAAAETAARLAAARAWLAGGADRHAIAPGDPLYPPTLLQTADPPLLLYLQGDPAVLRRPALAIVGSRGATPQGLANARAFARELAAQGWCIVSGLALGIDAAAHEGALDAAAGAGTVAVVGTGLDRVFPARHRALAHRIGAAGALLSEYAPGAPPLREHFPERNRIIAGFTQGTLVVEAALASGSLITARLASEAGREVFAIPGSIHSPQARGCHALIRQGAKLVETAEDIVEELRGQRALPLAGAGDDEAATPCEDPLLAALGHDPVTIDALLARTGDSAAALSARLLELELEGLVARLPGGLYQRLASG